jgi:outer membrane protein assembly factor BamE
VALVALLEQFKDFQTRQRGFEPMFLRSDGWLNGVSRTGTGIRYDTFFPTAPTSRFPGYASLPDFCSVFEPGRRVFQRQYRPHRIDVQQGNALDQENVARLKPGLSRSQVRFLLGTPLVVDPFRTDRWDYVCVVLQGRQAGRAKAHYAVFEGDTLARIEGDVPAVEPAVQPEPKAEHHLAGNCGAKPTTAPDLRRPSRRRRNQHRATLAQPGQRTGVCRSTSGDRAGVCSLKPTWRKFSRTSFRLSPERVRTLQRPCHGTEILNEWAEAWARRDSAAHLPPMTPALFQKAGSSRADWEKRKRR